MDRRRVLRLGLLVAATAILLAIGIWGRPFSSGGAERVAADAGEGARFLTESGYKADFTPASLWELDRFFEQHPADAKPRLRMLGAYTGEVIRRAKGGAWQDAPSGAPGGVELVLPDGTHASPHARVERRLAEGRSESIAPYAQSFGIDVRPVPGWYLEK